MIRKDGDYRELACDECGDDTGEQFHRIEFREMIEAAKDSGWKIGQDNQGEWRHTCPTCRDDDFAEDRLAAQLALFGRAR